MNGILQDIRYAARQLRRTPGFTAAALLTLALGIAANTAIFSVIEAVILRPLPFDTPDRLVWLNGKLVPRTDEGGVSPPDFRDYRANNRTFERIAAMGYGASPSNLSGDKPEQVLSSVASADFFTCLGVRPLLGRDFMPPDEQVNEPQVAILGYGVWKRDFGGDRDVVGRTIRMDGRTLTIVGVLPSDIPLLSEAQIWTPMPMLNRFMSFRMGHSLKAIGRLKPDVTLQQSQADLDAIALRLQQQYPDSNKNWWMRQRPLREVLIGSVRPALLMMWGAVGLLLIIACVNVANLLLARSISRHKEFALRTALGASRIRMIRQALTESLLLALAGGLLGVLAATWSIHLLHVFGPANVPRLNQSGMDSVVLAFTLGIAVLTGIVFGIVPALQISGKKFREGLQESGRISAPVSHQRLSSALVVGEIAMSLVLLVSAGLLLKSFWRLIHVSPGFSADRVLTARLSLNGPNNGKYATAPARVRFWRELGERIGTLPGVESVGATSELPLSGTRFDSPFHFAGRSYGPSEFDDAQFRMVTPGYRAVMGIPLVAGRWLDEADNDTSPGVVVVNQTFVSQFFPNGDAMGKRLQLADDRSPREIIGVVGDVRHIALSVPAWPEMYVPYAQFAWPTMNVMVRGAANPANLAAALRAQVNALDKDITLSATSSMDGIVDASISQPRFSSQLLGIFSSFSLLLAAVGLYGLIAYSVTQRKREIGIRMALGARREDILQLIIRHGSRLAAAGVVIGLVVSLAATRVLSSLLFAVTPRDPQILIGIAILLIAVALAACYVPARRAAKVDPMAALRYE